MAVAQRESATAGVAAAQERAREHVRRAQREAKEMIAASDQVRRVFERFYRVDAGRSRARGGSGIGLTIARALVEVHGGRITAESPGPGRGAAFTVTLPVATDRDTTVGLMAAAAVGVSQTHPRAPTSSHKGRCVLRTLLPRGSVNPAMCVLASLPRVVNRGRILTH